MDRLQKITVLTRLVERLKAHESWCGETHIQKATLLLQELFEVPTGFEFILYKHGPFSFDLRDELVAMRADMVLIPTDPYGSSWRVTENATRIQSFHQRTLAKYGEAIEFVARKTGGKNVGELERLATALWVTRREKQFGTDEERAERIHQLKPHVSVEAALGALMQLHEIEREAQCLDTFRSPGVS
jgi:hypothetical protein